MGTGSASRTLQDLESVESMPMVRRPEQQRPPNLWSSTAATCSIQQQMANPFSDGMARLAHVHCIIFCASSVIVLQIGFQGL